jgi:hypothetical protein
VSEVTCFRCDWVGSTRGGVCPRCGTPLHRAETEAPRRTEHDASLRVERDAPPRAELRGSEGDQRAATRRTSPWRVLAGMAAVGVVIAVASTTLHGPAAPRSSSAPRSTSSPEPRFAQGHGSLVFSTKIEPGRAPHVLWRLDLATDRSSQGPQIAPALDLVDATGVGQGWLGLTASVHGRQAAFLLHGTSPFVEPTLIDTGDLVAWGPGGSSIAVASHRRTRPGGCRSERIDVTDVNTGITQNVLEQPKGCGHLVSLGRSEASTYYTRSAPGDVGIFFTGVVGVPHPVLDGYGMLSVSPASDFLVVPAGGNTTGPPFGSPDRTPSGAVLFWRGHGGPVRLGDARNDLIVERVLAWSPDGAQAAVLGSLGSLDGVFVLDAGPGVERRAPTFVVSGGHDLGATFDDQGVLYLVIGGHMFSYLDGVLSDVLLPGGTPAPSAPIVWMP